MEDQSSNFEEDNSPHNDFFEDRDDDSYQSQNDVTTNSQNFDDILTPAFDNQNSSEIIDIEQFDAEIKKEEAINPDVVMAEEIKEKSKKELEEEEREKIQVLVSNFTEEQLDRYEMFRRSAFPKAAIKRLMQSYSGTTVSQNAVIAMSGIAKVLVGEIVELALDAMESQGESGPLQPKHLREAVRCLRLQQKLSIGKPSRRFAI